jgi:hypothetical protein
MVSGTISLGNSEIGHDLRFIGARIQNLDLSGSIVHGNMVFGKYYWDLLDESATQWSLDSELDLRHAHLGGIEAPTDLKSWPRTIRFAGFRFDSFIADHCDEETPCIADATWYEQWLNLGDRESKRSFESHQVVANMLTSQGENDSADKIDVHGHDMELNNAFEYGNWFRAAYLLVARYTVGYGLHPSWCLFSTIAITIIGAILFRRTPEARKWKINLGLAYSFDMLLPIIKLRELHYKIDIKGPTRYYFYIHKILGFILGSFLIAALAGWGK